MNDQNQDSNSYLTELQKLMSSDVLSTYWSHNMDLLVIVTVDNLVELYRISYKAQKVFQIQEKKPITAVCFSPDSLFIAYGMQDGQIKVLKTQNGESLLSVNDPISEQVNSLSFVEFGKYPLCKIFPFKQFTIMQKLILQILPHKNCKQSSIVKLNYFNELGNDDVFTLLVSSGERHTSLHLNGFVTIAQVGYDLVAAKHFNDNSQFNNQSQFKVESQFKVQFSHFNPHTYKLQCVVTQNAASSYLINLVQFDASILRDLHPHIIKFNCLLAYISEILSFVEMAYPAAQLCLRDILRQYNSKMNLIDDEHQQNVNPCVELFKYLNYGLPTTPLMNFLKKEVYDTKVLQKLDQVLNLAFNTLHDLLLQSIQNSLQRAYLLLKQLKGLAQLDKYKLFGVKTQDLHRIEQHIEKLYTMGEILLVQSTQAKFDIRNLLVWLNKASMKTANDPSVQTENSKSYLSRYTVDFTRLHGFLQSQNKFRLQNLICFFSKTSQTNFMRIPVCQFRLLNRVNNPHVKPSPQYIQKTKQIQSLLQLDNIALSSPSQKMCLQLSYRSFKLQHGQLQQQWKKMRVKPIIQVSKVIESRYEVKKIGQVEASEMRLFDVRPIVRKNEQTLQSELILYWISHSSSQSCDKLIEYSTTTHSTKYIALPPSLQALSLSVGVDKILLVQNPQNMQDDKSIVQILNQQWNGEELQSGRSVQKLSGEVLINAGMRGLNLLVQNKNRLVVFD